MSLSSDAVNRILLSLNEIDNNEDINEIWDEISNRRNVICARVKRTLMKGDTVSFIALNGSLTVGEVVKVNRVKCRVKCPTGIWLVPCEALTNV